MIGIFLGQNCESPSNAKSELEKYCEFQYEGDELFVLLHRNEKIPEFYQHMSVLERHYDKITLIYVHPSIELD